MATATVRPAWWSRPRAGSWSSRCCRPAALWLAGSWAALWLAGSRAALWLAGSRAALWLAGSRRPRLVGGLGRQVDAVGGLVRRQVGDQLVDLRLAIRVSAARTFLEDHGTEVAEHGVGAPCGLNLVVLGLALACELASLRLDLVHQSHACLRRSTALGPGAAGRAISACRRRTHSSLGPGVRAPSTVVHRCCPVRLWYGPRAVRQAAPRPPEWAGTRVVGGRQPALDGNRADPRHNRPE